MQKRRGSLSVLFNAVLLTILLLGLIQPGAALADDSYGGHVFLKGTYIEVGFNSNGWFGATPVPGGYHNNSGNGLGFVADYQSNGWSVPYGGDYFTPGTPYEGFGIIWDGIGTQQNSNAIATNIASNSLSMTSSGDVHSAVWIGHYANGSQDLRIIQTVSFHTGEKFFVVNVQLENIGTATINNLKFGRGVDPDNEQIATGSFNTSNVVSYQPGTPGNTDHKALVVARGVTYPAMALGLGAIDSRAKVTASSSFGVDPAAWLSSPVSSASGDNAIGLAFNLGNLAPGQSTSLDFAYILSEADLNTALGQLAAVTILAPTGTVSGSSVPIQVTTNDVPNTTSVDFYINNVLIGSDPIPTGDVFETTFDSKTYPNGTISIKAIAHIAGGANPEKTTTVTISNNGPDISFSTPESGANVSGDNIPLAVQVDSGAAPASVQFYREVGASTVDLGLVTSAPWQTTFNTSDLPLGTSITLRAVGRDGVGNVTNISVNVYKPLASPPTTLTSAAPAAGTYRQAYSHFFTADGTAPLSFSVVGALPAGLSLNPSTGELSGIPTETGSFTFRVLVSNGAGSYTSGEQTVVINKANTITSITSDLPDPSVFGQDYSVSVAVAPVTGGTPGGSVLVSDGAGGSCTITLASGSGSCSLPSLSVGDKMLTAGYGGDANFNPSSGTSSHAVIKADAAAIVSSTLTPSTYGEPVSFSASVSAAAPGAGTPTGSIQFTIDGNPFGDPVALVGGTADSLEIHTLTAGSHALGAVYSGDAGFNGVSASPIDQQIQAADTSLAISMPYNTAPYGTPQQLTAVVSELAPSLITPDGLVQFKLNGVDFGAPVSLAGGMVVSQNLPAELGAYSFTADYLGNANFNASSSNESLLLVEQAATALEVTSSLEPSEYGQNVTFTAAVAAGAPSAAVPVGTVQFKLDGVNFGGPVSLNGSGAAARTISYTALWPGLHSVTAYYSGNGNFAASDNSASPFQQTVMKAEPVAALTPSQPSAVTGEPFSVEIALSSDPITLGIPTGMVSLLVDGEPFAGPLALDASGKATIAGLALLPGSHVMTVQYDGDDYFTALEQDFSDPIALEKAEAAVSVSGFTPGSLVVGQATAIDVSAAAVAPGAGLPSGSVLVSNGIDSCIAVLADGAGSCELTPTAAGQPELTVEYSGDSSFNPASGSSAGPEVTQAETNLTFTGFDPAQPIVGQPVSVSVAVSVLSPGAGVPGGTVQLSSGGESCSFTLAGGAGSCVLTPAAPGQFELAAEYSGDSNFNPSSGSFAGPQVAKAASATTLTSSDLASVYGQPVTFTAVVDAAAPGYGAPTGSIQFFLNGAALGSPVALEHGAAESAPVSNLVPGTYSITAEYSGDGIFNPSAAPAINQAVAKADSTVTLESKLNPSPYGTPVTVVASVSAVAPSQAVPGGSVQFIVDGVNYGAAVPLIGGQASKILPYTALWVGNHTITVVYSGGAYFNPSDNTANPLIQQVVEGQTLITVVSSSAPTVYGQPVQFTITVSPNPRNPVHPTGTVVLSVDGAPSGAALTLDASGQAVAPFVQWLEPGFHSVSVAYSGDEQYGAKSVEFADFHQVLAADSALSVTGYEPAAVVTGQPITVSLAVEAAAPGAGLPSGSVLVDSGAGSCTAVLVDGAGACELVASAAGFLELNLAYSGDGKFNASSSLFAGPEVAPAETTTNLSSSAPSAVYGQPVYLTAQVAVNAPGAGTPAGTVQFYLNGIEFGSPAPVVGGSAESMSLANLGEGSYTVMAAYSGDASYNPSVSAEITQSVAKAGTLTVVASQLNPAPFGQPVAVTATVASAAPGMLIPDGSVQFVIDGLDFGAPVLLDAGGQAAMLLDAASLPVGYHTIAAFYSGAAQFEPSDNLADAFIQQVVGGATVIEATASAAPAVFGQPVTFTITIHPSPFAEVKPAGSVSVWIDGAQLAVSLPVDPSGQVVTPAIDSLAVGTHQLLVEYSGDDNYAANSLTLADAVLVEKAGSVIANITVDPKTVSLSMPFTVSLEVVAAAPGAGMPGGSVEVSNGGESCTITLMAGAGSCELIAGAIGQAELTAEYSGDDSFTGSQAAPFAGPEITKADTTISLLTFQPASIVVGQPYTISVSVGTAASGLGYPSGTVEISSEAQSCTLVLQDGSGACQLTPEAVGQPELSAVYSGDGIFNSSSLTGVPGPAILKADTFTSVSEVSPGAPVVGQPFTVTVQVAAMFPGSGLPEGPITVRYGAAACTASLADGIGACAITAAGAGSQELLAEYEGSSSYNASQSDQGITLEVGKAPTQVEISGPVVAFRGHAAVWTATVSAAAPGEGLPAGQVQFYLDGVAFGEPVDLVDGQAFSQTAVDLGTGLHKVTAEYLGSSDFEESTSEDWNYLVNPYRMFLPSIVRYSMP